MATRAITCLAAIVGVELHRVDSVGGLLAAISIGKLFNTEPALEASFYLSGF